MIKEVTKDITYVGCDDKTLDLFESQYIIPNGIAYNAYVIMDENIALIDTVDLLSRWVCVSVRQLGKQKRALFRALF